MEFKLPQLTYTFDALEPYIDAKTMEIHYTKHHQTYINNFEKALMDFPELKTKELADLLMNLKDVPEAVRNQVKNQGGGVFNHTLFWTFMAPNKGGTPQGELARVINSTFQNFDLFKKEFTTKALGAFGSGWTWLTVNNNKKLEIVQSFNQDSPVSNGLFPILGIDVWEHAYYLKYQNKRADYIDNWWNVVNWEQVNQYYQTALKHLA